MDYHKEPPPPYSAEPIPAVHQNVGYPNIPSAPYPTIEPQIPKRPPTYGATAMTNTIHIPETEIIIVSGCPVCRIGVMQDEYSCLGLLCAILFFPAGILCCLLMKEKRCSNCGACLD